MSDRQELERLRKLKRLRELEAKAGVNPSVDAVAQPQPLVNQQSESTQPESSFTDKALGAIENVGAIGAGMITEPVAGLAGIGAALIPGGKTGAEMVESVRGVSSDIFSPKTVEGQSQQQAIGEALQPVGEALQNMQQGAGDYIYEKTDSPLLASLASAAPDAALALIGSTPVASASRGFNTATKNAIAKIVKDSPQSVKAGKYMIDASGKIKKSQAYANAVKQGFDEATMAAVKGATSADKSRMKAMLNTLESGMGDARSAVVNRPSDIVGNSALQRIKFLKSANREAAKNLEVAANSLKGKPLDYKSAVDGFISNLDDMGVTFDSRMRPNFKGSDIEGAKGAERFIAKVVKRMRDTKTPDAYDAHRLKKFIDEQVTYGKVKQGLSGRAEGITKALRRDIDSALDNNFPAYDKANIQYSDTIGALDSIQNGIGKVDLFGDNANKAIGTALRRVMSNTQSRANLIGAIDELDAVSAKYGAKFDDDLITQALFADELDNAFNLQNRTTFKGQSARGLRQASQGKAGMAEAAIDKTGELLDKVRGFDDKTRIKSLRELLDEGKK